VHLSRQASKRAFAKTLRAAGVVWHQYAFPPGRYGPEGVIPDRARASVRPRLRKQSAGEVAEKVRAVLASKGLSLYQVSRRSETLYGRSSAFFIPHNFYYDLRIDLSRPSIYQIFVLSRISGYRLEDWARLFGFDLEDIPQTQVRLRQNRTILLDAAMTDLGDFVPWFHDRVRNSPVPSTAPLGHLLELAGPRRIGSLGPVYNRGFLYAKIGTEDAVAFPDLLPGSIVRVNPQVSASVALNTVRTSPDRLFLLEHCRGLLCCRIQVVDRGIILPVSSLLSYAQVELEFPREVRILGIVDLELRSLVKPEQPEIPKGLAQHWKPRPIASGGRFGDRLARARGQRHLSLREVASLSRSVGDLVGDDEYGLSPSTLWESEAFHAPPRDFRKLMSLCCIYGFRLRTLLESLGLTVEESGTEAIPDQFIRPRPHPDEVTNLRDQSGESVGFFDRLLEECEEVPFFCRGAIGSLSSLDQITLKDFFWIGGETEPLYPYLRGGLLAIVNRRRKTAVHYAAKSSWQQPVYMIQTREGRYLAACCSVEDGTLVIHPYARHPGHVYRPTQFQLHRDAELVGQVVAVARRI